jgi:hypothetical protein
MSVGDTDLCCILALRVSTNCARSQDKSRMAFTKPTRLECMMQVRIQRYESTYTSLHG